MTEINRIQAALRPHLSWHGARLTFLAWFLVALFRVETMNLDKLASVFANRAQSASNHQRLTCFFRKFVIDFDSIAQAVVSWSQIPEPYSLVASFLTLSKSLKAFISYSLVASFLTLSKSLKAFISNGSSVSPRKSCWASAVVSATIGNELAKLIEVAST